MNEVRTRFAPSPTGMMHIGSVRTALYAYLVARGNQGKFYLRIEDTDQTRSVEGAKEDIVANLHWLGLNFDEELITQSARKEIYQKYAQELIEKETAYEKEGAIWFKMPKEGELKFSDLIGKREIVFNLSKEKDFVLLKSDGFPTYHLAHVVDDHLMKTNPVIRADEWLSSIPKHILVFQAFGWSVPQYAHLPLILGSDRSKLSKRHGAKGVGEFRKDGFLPEAILNYMALLGWTPDQEILSLEEMIRSFNLEKVHSTPAVFDMTKLEWMNGEYIRKSQNSNLKSQIWNYLLEISGGALAKGHPTQEEVEKVIPAVKERIKKLSDFVPLTDFLWEKPEYDLAVFKKIKIDDQKMVLEKITAKLVEMEKPWDAKIFESTFRALADSLKITAGEIFQLIRVAVSGQLVTPPLFESMQILGEKETINRVKTAASQYPNF